MKFFIVSLFIFFATSAVSQTNDQAATYHSEADDLVTMDKVSYAPFVDNLSGIYSRPMEAHFAQVLGEMHRWSVGDVINVGGATLEELEENPQKVKESFGNTGSDALFACKFIKGPKGLSIKLDLFLARDGKLFLQEEVGAVQQFDLNMVQEQLDTLLTHILHKIPYSGRVMSRDVNRVTVNVGTRDGLQKGQIVSVIQIIKLNRHPKFNFVVSADKEIIGKIKILKVDDTLSFGTLALEKQHGAVQKGSKLDSLEFVTYSANDLSLAPLSEENLQDRQDSKVAFGKDAKAWKPMPEPSIGQVGASLGWSMFNESRGINSGSVGAHDNFTPIVALNGELWITSNWTIHANLQESILSVNNPVSGSEPGSISQTLSAYELLGGYRFRFGPGVWSPYVEPFVGFMTYRLYADSTTPTAFTTMQYSGFKIGIQGESPIMDEWSAGGMIAFVIEPSLQESPGSSGSSSTNNINQFGVWGARKLTEHWKAQINLEFDSYSSSFSGQGGLGPTSSASSASQKWLTLSGAMYYMF